MEKKKLKVYQYGFEAYWHTYVMQLGVAIHGWG